MTPDDRGPRGRPARKESPRGGRNAPLPRKLTLPSGRAIRIAVDVLEADRVAVVGQRSIRAVWRLLALKGALSDDGGVELELDDLELADAHLLASLVFRAGYVEEREVDVHCDNCGRTWRVRPSSAVEPGPFIDGELDDPELDAPFQFDRAHEITPTFTGAGIARSVRLAKRTFGQARSLYRTDASRALTRATVLALGIQALGKEKKTAAIASSLSRASEDTWTTLGEVWEAAHYPSRLIAEVYCECGARSFVHAPADRAFDGLAPLSPIAAADPDPEGVLSLDAFEAEVERAKASVFAARGVRNLPVIVDAGVPACDEGGEPLLGSYQPPGADALGVGERPAEIHLFYRTFQSELRFDSSFDVKGEIRETLDHEVEHHLYFLQGFDPMDAQERAVIAKERQRVIGKKELIRRDVMELGRVVRALLPLLLLLVLLAYLRFCRS